MLRSKRNKIYWNSQKEDRICWNSNFEPEGRKRGV